MEYGGLVTQPKENQSIIKAQLKTDHTNSRALTKLKVKIQSVLAYEGVKLSRHYGLFTRNGVDWFWGLGLKLADCYIRLMESLKEEIRLLSREPRVIAWNDQDIVSLITISGVGYKNAPH